jgi:predicted ArsR family transcriptional regulator
MLRAMLEPLTAGEIAAKLGLNHRNARCIVVRMRALGLAHIHSWTPVGKNRMPQARWAIGAGKDAERPLAFHGGESRHGKTTRPRPKPIAQLVAFAAIWRALAVPQSMTSLAEITGCHATAVRRLVRILRSLGLARIAAYQRRSAWGGTPTAMFEVAINKPDAARPELVPPAQRQAKYKRKLTEQAAMKRLMSSLVASASVDSLTRACRNRHELHVPMPAVPVQHRCRRPIASG